MSRRFIADAKLEKLAKHFAATVLEPCNTGKIYAPGDMVPMVVRSKKTSKNELKSARFGIIPSFAIDPRVGRKLYNCRAETVDIKPSFRASFEARRCLVPATGFYEWHLHNKEPHLVVDKENDIMAFAGVWDRWRDDVTGDVVTSLSIITTDAAGDLSEIHQRMPVILDKKAQDAWLDSKADPEKLKALLKPYAKVKIEVSDAVMVA